MERDEREPTTAGNVPLSNSMSGTATGPVVQAGVVHGGLYFGNIGGARAVELPYRFGSVPPRADCFQPRLVAAALDGSRTGSSSFTPGVYIFTGLGGVGKTQLAADLAEHAWAAGDVDLLVWIAAVGRDVVLSEYVRLARDLTGVEDTDPSAGVARLLAWLAMANIRWLIVLDDVQIPSDLHDLWPPSTRHGQVIVTTRRKDAALIRSGQTMVDVGPFTPAESAAYLAAKFAGHQRLADG